MNPNSPDNMNNDINFADKLQEIQTLLAGQEFQIYTNKDKEYEYLDEGYYCLTLKNTKGNPLYIDLTDEFMLTYKGRWHCHYAPDSRGYSEMLHDLRGILDNKLLVLDIYSKERWESSSLLDFNHLQFWDEDRSKIIRSERMKNDKYTQQNIK